MTAAPSRQGEAMAVATKLTRSERAALTRRELLDVAQRRFFADGYHATTLDDIADEAGYTKGAVYSTFKSKAGLFLALFDEVVDRTVASMRALLASQAPREAKIAALARNPVQREPAVPAAGDRVLGPRRARRGLLAAFSASYRRLRSKLAELAPESGPFDEQRWAILTLACSNGLALERLIDPDGVPDDLMAAVQQLLIGPPTPPTGSLRARDRACSRSRTTSRRIAPRSSRSRSSRSTSSSTSSCRRAASSPGPTTRSSSTGARSPTSSRIPATTARSPAS